MADIQYHFGTGDGDPNVHHGQTNVDVDGDGTTDAIAVDFDGDGRYDDAMWDSDGDGAADTALLDLNDDGVAESAYHDPSGEGTWNAKGQAGEQEPAEAPVQPADNPDSGFENQPPAEDSTEPQDADPTEDAPAEDAPTEAEPTDEPPAEDEPAGSAEPAEDPASADGPSLTEWFEDLKPADDPGDAPADDSADGSGDAAGSEEPGAAEPVAETTDTGEPSLSDWYDDLKPLDDDGADTTDVGMDDPATDHGACGDEPSGLSTW
ncbi:hypothetical protein ACTG9Q_02765 [Actinokineospora sp. 24-640]